MVDVTPGVEREVRQEMVQTQRAQVLDGGYPLQTIVELNRSGKVSDKVLEAVRIVPRPDLSKPETAEQFYVEFVRRMATLYTAALPYLRRALQELCTVAGVELPPSWPDALPFAARLP